MSVFGTAGPIDLSTTDRLRVCELCGETVDAIYHELLWFACRPCVEPRKPPHVVEFFDADHQLLHRCYRSMDEIELATYADLLIEHGGSQVIHPAIEPRHAAILRARLAGQ